MSNKEFYLLISTDNEVYKEQSLDAIVELVNEVDGVEYVLYICLDGEETMQNITEQAATLWLDKNMDLGGFDCANDAVLSLNGAFQELLADSIHEAFDAYNDKLDHERFERSKLML